jgi:pimeloyl-ACP methyl ester carboxylesterase
MADFKTSRGGRSQESTGHLDRDGGHVVVARQHGSTPLHVVVVHGGPGAAGELGPVARRLALRRGVLEPFQTATTVDGQVDELQAAIETRADPPVAVVGHSWGAWLSSILAAKHPRLVRKLILVGSGPFEEQYVPLLRKKRLQRLTRDEQDEFRSLADQLGRPDAEAPTASLQRLGELGAKTDTFEPIDPEDAVEADQAVVASGPSSGVIYASVWPEAARLRQTGQLLRLIALIECPVVAIHGAYDPHPAEGVSTPLARTLRDFHMVVLDKCGHDPWRERHAAEAFYDLLDRELSS